MPRRNTILIDAEDSYYHVYTKGADGRDIFIEENDFVYFMSLFKRYLSEDKALNSAGVAYPNFYANVKLLCFCLMDNHIHILLYQKELGAMSKFMLSTIGAYSTYMHIKYGKTGALFEGRYKKNIISNQSYYEHLTRYIHLNPRNWKNYKYSSIQEYKGDRESAWLSTKEILSMFTDRAEYLKFVSDYEANKKMLAELKYELAGPF